ncbi:hypothetical protein T439DRAFT_329358 [Meredithblackwellia eburnea MCA 4105]
MAPTSAVKDLKRKRDETEDISNGITTNTSYKQRVLLVSSRGITQRHRHLLNDIHSLLPHSKKDSKLDSKHHLPLLNELAYLSNSNNCLFFEARRKYQDLYLWAAKTPNGPSVRFHVMNIHTMEEIKMSGNCLKGSRPVIVFGNEFDQTESWRLVKECLSNIFAVPKTARKAKPFVDHVITFSIVDGKVWFRNFQILDTPPPVDPSEPTTSSTTSKRKEKEDKKKGMSLSEIGPRFVLNPVKIFEGSFNGATIFENKEFVPSSQSSHLFKKDRANKYLQRKGAQREREERREEAERGQDEARDSEISLGRVFA